jgi:hypothetical protein
MRSEIVDSLIASVLAKLRFDNEIIELCGDAYSLKTQSQDKDIQSILENLSNEAKLLSEKELLLVEGYTSSIIREEVYTLKMRELELKQLSLSQQMEKTEQRRGKTLVTFEQVKNVILEGNKAAEAYLAASPEAKRTHLQNLLSNISIKNKNVVNYQFKSPFDILANCPKNADFHSMLAVWDDIRTALVTSDNHIAAVIDINSYQTLSKAG